VTVYTAAGGQWGGPYTHSCPGTATGLSQGTRGFSGEGSPRTWCEPHRVNIKVIQELHGGTITKHDGYRTTIQGHTVHNCY